jgi:type VI protein secretion system component Hcp
VLSLKIGDQITLASNPWYVTPPPGVRSLTLTKNTDVSSPGLSNAFAWKTNSPFARIRLVTLDNTGAVKRVYEYLLRDVVVSSFTVTPPTETLVLDFSNIIGRDAPMPPSAPPSATSGTRSRRR